MKPIRLRTWVKHGGVPGLLAAGVVVGLRHLWLRKRRAVFLSITCLAAFGLFARHIAQPGSVRYALPMLFTKQPASHWKPADVAGDYYFGDGLGVNCSLHLGQDATCAFQWTGCEGVYDHNSGEYVLDGDLLMLRLTRPNNREGFEGTPTRFYPVRWGKRLYMVSDEQMLGFCIAAGRGWQPGDSSQGIVYMRRGDQKRPVSGLPDVPRMFRRYFRAPFSARVLAIGPQGQVTINRGAADGIAVRTRLAPQSEDWLWLRVTAVTDQTAECVLHNPDLGQPRIIVGTDLVAVQM